MKPPCSSCGARVLWAQTSSGKAIPLDPEPVPGGNIDLIGREAVVRKAEPQRPGYVSHFWTCPNAGAHRRRKTPAGSLELPFGKPGKG